MENFVLYNPTSLHFGKGVITNLPGIISTFGKKVLLVYGKGAIKENGIYNEVMDQLKKCNAEVFEYSGIKSNPVINDVDKAAVVGRKNKVDVVLAVGGGSVIDSAKIISLAIPVENKAWDFFEYKIKPKAAVPLVAVLTLAATGTEMNPFAVVQNDETKQKPGYYSPLIYPRHALLDPDYTISVPENYTAYGIVDLIAHALENYFGTGDTTLTDKIIFAIIKEAVEFGGLLMQNPDSFAFREKIMFAATLALNGTTSIGKKSGDWGVHGLGHSLSALYDTPHGASLSVMYPSWMKYFKNQLEASLILLGENVFGVETADDTILAIEQFFYSIQSPIRLYQIGLSTTPEENEINAITQNLILNKVTGGHMSMDENDYKAIIKLAY
jgi:alcohol dehydrogenase YqhD (iron-dependent ADH family)